MTKEIIFHAGLPKTGTTSIQRTLYINRRQLASAGIFYPEPDSPADPKHQFLVTGLLSGRHESLGNAIEKGPAGTVILLSAEGLSNHLFDFPQASLEAFRNLIGPYRCRAVLVTRPWKNWLKSYFKQSIVNPRHELYTHYAFSDSLEAFENHERVRPFSDPTVLKSGLIDRLGIETVDTIEYSPRVLEELIAWLPRHCPTESLTRLPEDENTSLSDVAAEVVRQVNGIVEDRRERGRWISLVAELDGASNTIARSANDARGKCDGVAGREVLSGLGWHPGGGLNVSRDTFNRFVARLASKVGETAD